MATVKSQQFIPWDVSTLANYKTLFQAIGTGMAAIGWTKLGSPTGALVLTSVANASADSTSSTGACSVYTGTITGGASNALAGLNFIIAGFTTSANNGTFTCVASSTTTLTLSNASGASETHAATATGDCGQVTSANVVLPASAQPGASNILNFRGAWVKNTAYAVNDIVNDGGNCYTCNTAASASYVATAVTQASTTSTLTGTFPSEATSNGWAGLSINVSGFVTTPANNGDFVVLTSSTTTLTYTNASGVNETHASVVFHNSGPGTKHTGTIVHSNLPIVTPSSNLWLSWNFEIWTNSASPLYSTHPIYVQFIYTNAARPEILFRCGNVASTSTGLIAGNVFNGWGTTAFLPIAGAAGTSNQGSPLFEMDICGDVSKFTMIPARTISSGFLVVDYAKDSTGGDIDTYFFVAKSSSNVPQLSQVVFKLSNGSLNPQGTNGLAASEIPAIFSANTTASVNGLTPVSPIFPNPGYIGNPILGAVCIRNADAVEGELINVVLYGSSHTYLVTRANSVGIAGVGALAMRWEAV